MRTNTKERGLQRLGWLLHGSLLLMLAGCGSSSPMWIRAPLLADSSRDVPVNGSDRPFDESLLVGEDTYAELKFSLDTLPNGALSKLIISNNSATVGTENYALTPEKVFRARLVLFVDHVVEPGHIRVEGAYTPGSDCYLRESVRPSCTQTVAGAPLATDADAPTQAFAIHQRGYHSVDVTELVKHRMRNGYAGVLRVHAVRDAQENRWSEFLFASKEKVMGAAGAHHHQPQLLITLTDAAGITSSSFITSSVQNSQSNPALGDRDFSADPHMLANGVPTEIAYALVQPRSLPTGGATIRSFFNQIGTRSYKMTMVTSVDVPVPFSAQEPARIDWYRRGRLSNPANNNRVITWNNGWSEPAASALITTTPLATGEPAQLLQTQIGGAYVDALRAAYAADSSVDFAVAGKTNVQDAVLLEARRNAHAARAPLFTTVITPVPPSTFFVFDTNDTTRNLKYCIGVLGTGALCDAPTLSLRARAGQPYPGTVIVDIRSLTADSNVPYATPLHIDVPSAGPGVDIDTDPDPDSQSLAAGLADGIGYYIRVRRANDIVGAFKGILSMPGHNLRAEIDFTNLPLPVPSLSGPARVTLPAGASTIAVPADAALPFVLDVDDEYVNANIDDTTKWLFSSSEASDTMPAETQQTDGSVNLAMTFGSVGPRTITVRSKGDSRISTTFDLVIDGGSATVLAEQGPIPVFGQAQTLVVEVRDHGGEPVASGTVEFRAGASVLGSADIEDGTASLTTASLAVGVHLITAHYAGNPGQLIAASTSPARSFAVDRAATAMTLSAPAIGLVDDPIAIEVTLQVVAPGAGAPTGNVTIGDGEVSCSFDVAVASGCTLAPTTAGLRVLQAHYTGDTSFVQASASAPLTVLERAVLAPSLADGRGHVRYGRVVDYIVTVRNDGLGAATAVPVDATLSAAFDGDFAQWQCFGAGAGASCIASGSGPLHDVATIPPGRSLTWRISVPVRHDTPETEAVFTLDVGGPAPQSLVDRNVIVLMRDAFDEPYASSVPIGVDRSLAVLVGEAVHTFLLPPPNGVPVEDVLLLRDARNEIVVQRTGRDAATPMVRILARTAEGIERVSPWARANLFAPLALSALRPEGGIVTVLLEGAETPLVLRYRISE